MYHLSNITLEGVLYDSGAVRTVSVTEVPIMTVKHTLKCNIAIIQQLPTK